MFKKKHYPILQAIIAKPAQSGVIWSEIETLMIVLGAELSGGRVLG